MALAVLAKLYPIFFVPVLLRRWGKWGTTTFAALTILFHVPYIDIGLNLFTGILYAVNTTYFNGSVFPLVTNLVEWTDLASNPGFVAQIVVYAIYASLLLWSLSKSIRCKIGPAALMKTTFLLTGAVLLLNRSFFPWYVIWMTPFLAFYTSLSWLLLSGTIFLGYMKYNAFPPPDFEALSPQMALVINLVEYVPFYLILIYELLKHKIRLNSMTGSVDLRSAHQIQ
jgi:hypothetical protein